MAEIDKLADLRKQDTNHRVFTYHTHILEDIRTSPPSPQALAITNNYLVAFGGLNWRQRISDQLHQGELARLAALTEADLEERNPGLLPNTRRDEVEAFRHGRKSFGSVARNRFRESEQGKLVTPGIFSVLETISGREIVLDSTQPSEEAIRLAVESFARENNIMAGHTHLINFLQESAVAESRDRKEARRGNPLHRLTHRRGARHHLTYGTVALMERLPLADDQKERIHDIVFKQTDGVIKLLTDPGQDQLRHFSRRYNDTAHNGVFTRLHPDIIHNLPDPIQQSQMA